MEWLKNLFQNPWFIGISCSIVGGAILLVAPKTRGPICRWIKRLLRMATRWPVTHPDAVVRSARVLVVDDQHQQFANYELLENRGYHITRRSSLDSRQPGALDGEFDVVVLDVRGVQDGFGASDGIHALQLLRDDNPWIPVILYTAYPDDLTPEQEQIVQQLAEPPLSKFAPFKDLEGKIMASVLRGRERAHFEATLARIGIVNPDEVLASLQLDTKGNPKWRAIEDSKRSPFVQRQVEDVIQVARSILDGTRWTP